MHEQTRVSLLYVGEKITCSIKAALVIFGQPRLKWPFILFTSVLSSEMILDLIVQHENVPVPDRIKG